MAPPPGRLPIALSVLTFAALSAGPAAADVVIEVPAVATTTVPTPPVTPDPPGRGGPKVKVPHVAVPDPRDGSRPTLPTGPDNGVPTPTPPVSTPTPPVTTQPQPDPPPHPPAPPAQPVSPAADTATITARPATTAVTKTAPPGKIATGAAIRRTGSARRARATRRAVAATPRAASTARALRPVRPTRHSTAPAPDPAPPKAPSKPRDGAKAGSIQATIADVVDLLPGWVLAVFLGFAAMAAAMAVNGYVTSRRARRLAAQRAALADDVGHLQAALLAPVPSTPGDVSFSVAYRPAAGLAAGGDFYDVFELDATRTAMLLGDVSGHGRESVGHAALVRYTLRTFIAAGHTPAEAIALTDRCLDGQIGDQFATVVAALYDHDAHTLTYARAGHHPPLLLGVADPPATRTTPPVGAGLVAAATDVTLDVAPGATVCFFTDGLVEARADGSAIGTDWAERVLADTPDDAEALIAAVAAQADELNDDLAVCLLHRPEEDDAPSPARPELAVNV